MLKSTTVNMRRISAFEIKFGSISADPEMQNKIDSYISDGKGDFDVFVLVCFKYSYSEPINKLCC
jgi:hypothetical protein